MKKAFCVWPKFDDNIMAQALGEIKDGSFKLLEEAGFSTYLVETNEPFDKWSELLFNYQKGDMRRFFIRWSDYVRLAELEKILKEGNEAFYFDVDLLILRPPVGYGCALETHLQSEGTVENVVKYWFRGVNSAYHLAPKHLPYLEKHLEGIRDHIVLVNGKVNFCHVMNYIYHIEENIGYIRNYFHFGSLAEPMFCTEEKIYDKILLYAYLTGIMDNRIDAVNCMGSRITDDGKSFVDHQLEVFNRINNNLVNMPLDRDKALKKFESLKGLRIRPNYHSLITREKIKQAIKGNLPSTT